MSENKATAPQKKFLRKFDIDVPDDATKADASRLIDVEIARIKTEQAAQRGKTSLDAATRIKKLGITRGAIIRLDGGIYACMDLKVNPVGILAGSVTDTSKTAFVTALNLKFEERNITLLHTPARGFIPERMLPYVFHKSYGYRPSPRQREQLTAAIIAELTAEDRYTNDYGNFWNERKILDVASRMQQTWEQEKLKKQEQLAAQQRQKAERKRRRFCVPCGRRTDTDTTRYERICNECIEKKIVAGEHRFCNWCGSSFSTTDSHRLKCDGCRSQK